MLVSEAGQPANGASGTVGADDELVLGVIGTAAHGRIVRTLEVHVHSAAGLNKVGQPNIALNLDAYGVETVLQDGLQIRLRNRDAKRVDDPLQIRQFKGREPALRRGHGHPLDPRRGPDDGVGDANTAKEL